MTFFRFKGAAHPRLPIVLLTAVIVLVTLLDWALDFSRWMAVPFLIELSWNQLVAGNGSMEGLRLLSTVVTCAFLHGNVEHLMGNMLFFWIFGAVILEICGWRWMLAIFFLTAIGASVGHLLMERGSPIPMLGASGTVMGFEGAYLGFVVRKPRPDPMVWPMAYPIPPGRLALVGIMGVTLDVMGILNQSPWDRVAYGAHIGGFVTGILVSFLRKD